MQHIDLNNKTILVTGSPGFIGANLVIRLLKEMSGGTVVSLDNMNDYYDPALKEYRLGLVEKAAEASPVKHVFIRGSIGDKALVDDLFAYREQHHRLLQSVGSLPPQSCGTPGLRFIFLRLWWEQEGAVFHGRQGG